MNTLSQNYWKNDQFGMWGFYWSEEQMNKILENKLVFIEKYIKVCIKYGMNIPIKYIEGVEIYALINSIIDKNINISSNQWYILNHLHVLDNIPYPIFPCLLYLKNVKSIFSDKYIGVGKLTTYRQENLKNNDFSELIKIWTFINIDNTAPSIVFYLNTNAFFSELENVTINGELVDIDNSDLAYLNTTRLNSYIRDLTVLFFEFGANELAFDDLVQVYDENKKSIYFEDIYLKVKGEILFYEDIYDILLDEHKYKPFEEIQVELDDTNYRDYITRKNKSINL